MAERYFKHLTVGKDIQTFSAGLHAGHGWRASREAIKFMSDLNLDLTAHISKPLDQETAKKADMLVVMTETHKDTLIGKWPDVSAKVYLLREFGKSLNPQDQDVMDPVGCPVEIYEKCFNLMKEPIEHLSEIICKE